MSPHTFLIIWGMLALVLALTALIVAGRALLKTLRFYFSTYCRRNTR